MSSSFSEDSADDSSDGSGSPLASVLGKRVRDPMAVTDSHSDRYRTACYDLLGRLNYNRLKVSISVSEACYNVDGSLQMASCRSHIGDVWLDFRYSKEESIPTATSLYVSIPEKLQSTMIFDCKPVPLSPDSETTMWVESRQFPFKDVDLDEIASALGLDRYKALSLMFSSVGIDLRNPTAISSRSGWLQHYVNAISGITTDSGYESEDSSEKRDNAHLERRLKRQKQEGDQIFELYFDHVWKPL